MYYCILLQLILTSERSGIGARRVKLRNKPNNNTGQSATQDRKASQPSRVRLQKGENKMFTSGLTNTPITKTLLIYILVSSILLSILDIKHLAGIQVSPHFWTYGQFWRAALWHVAGFANSTEALFAGILVYQVRVVERAWGGRKVAVRLLSSIDNLTHPKGSFKTQLTNMDTVLATTSPSLCQHYHTQHFSLRFSSHCLFVPSP